jgi:hypothetical protein
VGARRPADPVQLTLFEADGEVLDDVDEDLAAETRTERHYAARGPSGMVEFVGAERYLAPPDALRRILGLIIAQANLGSETEAS